IPVAGPINPAVARFLRRIDMKQVTIRRCPVCHNIGNLTSSVTAALKNDQDTNVKVVDGAKGEFTVEVDGRPISKKPGETLPTVHEVIEGVHGKTRAGV